MSPPNAIPVSASSQSRLGLRASLPLFSFRGSVATLSLLFLLAASLPILAADATEACITGLAVKMHNKKILASFRLENGFDASVLERVQSGLPTSFNYEIELVRKRRIWWDKDLAVSDLQAVAMFNAITREYLINFKQDGKLVASRVVHDAADLQQAMTHFEDLLVAGFEVLPEDGRVRLRIRAQLGSKTVMSFIPKDVHTDWVESPLLALPPAPPR